MVTSNVDFLITVTYETMTDLFVRIQLFFVFLTPLCNVLKHSSLLLTPVIPIIYHINSGYAEFFFARGFDQNLLFGHIRFQRGWGLGTMA